jgi:hypothetical protein
MIYSQMMVPLKVCMLATKISTTYLKVRVRRVRRTPS